MAIFVCCATAADWRPDAVPAGYSLSLLGMVVFGLGGAIDLTGHALFGFEADMEALLSPSHIALFVGWALIALGPTRSALLRGARGGGERPTLTGMMPALIGWTLFTDVIAFAAMAYLPTVQNPWMLADIRTDIEFFGTALGVMGVLLETALLIGASLWLIRNFRLPFGSFTLFFSLFALLGAVIDPTVVFVPVFIATGLAADALYRALRPSAARPGRSQLFAALLLALTTAAAHSPLSGGSGGTERLLQRKPAGPYTVTIDGERLLGHAHLALDVRLRGDPLPADSTIEVEITPPASAGSAARSYRAVPLGDRFLIDPLELEASGDWGNDSWQLDIRIAGPAGPAETGVGIQVYPPAPDAPTIFDLGSAAAPLLLLLGTISLFALRGTPMVMVEGGG